MKQSSELNQLIDELIEVYKVQKTRRKQIMVKEVEDFQRFFYAITGAIDKYKQMQYVGLHYIESNKKSIYEKLK
tara:strand:+ start:25 stop:246 length:222 start_codon:yes stop_codon:yes gene_type:complete